MPLIDKQTRENFLDLADELKAAQGDLETAEAEFNDVLTEARKKLQAEIDKANQTVANYNDALDDIARIVEEYMDEKSDKWMESEKGEAFTAWLEALQNGQQPEFEMPDIDVPPIDMGEGVDDLPLDYTDCL